MTIETLALVVLPDNSTDPTAYTCTPGALPPLYEFHEHRRTIRNGSEETCTRQHCQPGRAAPSRLMSARGSRRIGVVVLKKTKNRPSHLHLLKKINNTKSGQESRGPKQNLWKNLMAAIFGMEDIEVLDHSAKYNEIVRFRTIIFTHYFRELFRMLEITIFFY